MKNFVLIVFLILPYISFSQISNERCKWVKGNQLSFVPDSLSIIPGSCKIKYPSNSSYFLHYDIQSNMITLSGVPAGDSILICYKVFPFNLTSSYSRRPMSQYDSGRFFRERSLYSGLVPETREEIFSSPGLNKNGVISRGISFGNNQNVFVNSSLNLQMEGKLTDDLHITAVISDQNIPFQPEGNTQQIQDFDKVYVQVDGKNASVTAGDVVMKNPDYYFLKYYRNVQGGQFRYMGRKDSAYHSETSAGVAISKGKFASILVDPIEGVQGPYRLKGPNNEKFIVVLSNSEKVFLDGRQLQRGFDYDYVIDYNQAEITFTSNIVITKFSRIRVDFEYSDRNYTRSITNANHLYSGNKFDFSFGYYAEKDNPRNPLTVQLSNADRYQLGLVGDSVQRAYVPGADSVEYSSRKVLYKNIGSDINPIYVYSTNKDSAFYEVKFNPVASGTGNYIKLLTTVNGTVYEYVGTGGDYIPYILVPTPKKKSMMLFGGKVKFTKDQYIYSELVMSDYDPNLYSSLDQQDNKGFAYKTGIVNNGKKINFIKGYKWIGSADYEYDQRNFNPIDRFRHVDFERDWSANTNIKATDQIFNSSFGIIKNQNNYFNYRFSMRKKGVDVNGYQNQIALNKSFGSLQILGSGFLMKNNRETETSNWKRGSVSLVNRGRILVPGIAYTFDKNAITDDSGRVTRTAMYFDEGRAFLKTNDSLNFRGSVEQALRKDEKPFQGILKNESIAWTTTASGGGKIGSNHDINLVSTYRYLNNLAYNGTPVQDEETVMGRIDWNSDFLNRHFRSELTVSSGTGRELKREFVFIPVPVAQGTHVWVDENKNGVQELSEFYEKKFDDPNGEYIKSFIPTDTYIKAYSSQFNYRMDITAPRKWLKEKGWKNLISRFSNISSWNVNKKILDNDFASRFLPTTSGIKPEDLLSVQKNIRSTLFFNRTNTLYGMDVSVNAVEQKQFLTQGFEQRNVFEERFNSRLNLTSKYGVKLDLVRGEKANHSNFLKSRNYMIQWYQASPELSWQPTRTFRLSGNASFTQKLNVLPGSLGENVNIVQTGIETRINKVGKRTVNGTVKYIHINADFKGTEYNTALGYEMLEALQPGNNFTWNIHWQERLANGLQLSFTYEGRKPDSSKAIHIGRMQVSALF